MGTELYVANMREPRLVLHGDEFFCWKALSFLGRTDLLGIVKYLHPRLLFVCVILAIYLLFNGSFLNGNVIFSLCSLYLFTHKCIHSLISIVSSGVSVVGGGQSSCHSCFISLL